MFILYTLNTPNGHKVSIALEEMGLEYRIERVDVRTGAQFDSEFVKLNLNSKVPVLTDTDTGITTAESNAILLYLVEKTGMLMPVEPRAKAKAMELLFFQAASVGPLFGQRAHFRFHSDTDVSYARNRYDTEGARLYQVMDAMLSDGDWFVEAFSIVDIAVFAWIHTAVKMHYGIAAYPNLSAWYDNMLARPAVQKGVTIPDVLPEFPKHK